MVFILWVHEEAEMKDIALVLKLLRVFEGKDKLCQVLLERSEKMRQRPHEWAGFTSGL